MQLKLKYVFACVPNASIGNGVVDEIAGDPVFRGMGDDKRPHVLNPS